MFNSFCSRMSEFACNLLTPQTLLFHADVFVVVFRERGLSVKTNPPLVTVKLLMQVILSRPSVCSKDIYCSNTDCVLPVSYQCWFVLLVYVRLLCMELIRLFSSR